MLTNILLGLLLVFTAGLANGLHETIHYHFSAFQRVFPAVKVQYWNPEHSWTNKYKNGDKAQGERFLFASTALVFLTDAKHLADLFRIYNAAVGFAILGYNATCPWMLFYLILAAAVIMSAGFHLIYTLIFHPDTHT